MLSRFPVIRQMNFCPISKSCRYLREISNKLQSSAPDVPPTACYHLKGFWHSACIAAVNRAGTFNESRYTDNAKRNERVGGCREGGADATNRDMSGLLKIHLYINTTRSMRKLWPKIFCNKQMIVRATWKSAVCNCERVWKFPNWKGLSGGWFQENGYGISGVRPDRVQER